MCMRERRRYRRYSAMALGCRCIGILCPVGEAWEHEDLSAIDLSFGGICIRTHRALEPGAECRLLVSMEQPLGTAAVRSRVQWVRAIGSGEYVAGLEFLESSKAWIGPEENGEHMAA